jgi:hypothetical protein
MSLTRTCIVKRPLPVPPTQFRFSKTYERYKCPGHIWSQETRFFYHFSLQWIFLLKLFLCFCNNLVIKFFSSKRPYPAGSRPVSNGYRSSFPGLKQPWRESNRSSPSSAQVKNEWGYTFTARYVFVTWEGKFFLFFTILTRRSRAILENLTGMQLVKKFLAFSGTRRFITALTRARHGVSILSQLNPVHTSTSYIL